MSNKKQTAVEWLIHELSINNCISVPGEFWNNYKELVQQAKEMEKEQIIDAYKEGDDHGFMATESYNVGEESEQYYNQTYGE